MKKTYRLATVLILALALIGGLIFFGLRLRKKSHIANPSYKDKYTTFLFEVYRTIEENYWDKIKEEDLVKLYVLGIEKINQKPLIETPANRAGLQKTLEKTFAEMEEGKRKEFAASLADIVLANLKPFGRSRLYNRREETELKNRVENRNPEIDQYEVLGVGKEASEEEIKKAYQEKSAQAEGKNTPEAKKELAQLKKAYQVLADREARRTYDESGVEPTMEYRLVTPNIFYVHIKKFSPTTVQELLRVTQKVDDKPASLNSLIIDLRDNVGGAIDGLPYFLGPFIGNDQYAYQFYRQGEKKDFKTKVGWLPSLVRYKKVVVLINEGTQSSAEVMAAVLKKYNVGVLVGTKTRGWGTVERVFELKHQLSEDEKYSAFLVHSLTLRDDGLPIEGAGVEPMVNIKNPNWEDELNAYFSYPELTRAVKNLLTNS